jgi:hypothetical protein
LQLKKTCPNVNISLKNKLGKFSPSLFLVTQTLENKCLNENALKKMCGFQMKIALIQKLKGKNKS